MRAFPPQSQAKPKASRGQVGTQAKVGREPQAQMRPTSRVTRPTSRVSSPRGGERSGPPWSPALGGAAAERMLTSLDAQRTAWEEPPGMGKGLLAQEQETSWVPSSNPVRLWVAPNPTPPLNQGRETEDTYKPSARTQEEADSEREEHTTQQCPGWPGAEVGHTPIRQGPLAAGPLPVVF